MNFFYSIILGIVEGITEFLPVSSTGHLILTAHLLGIRQTVFSTSFEIAIQIGAILAVVVAFRERFFSDLGTLKRIGMAFLPTALIGFLVYRPLKKFLLNAEPVILISLFLGGIVLILTDKFSRVPTEPGDDNASVGARSAVPLPSYTQSILIGLFQCLAFIPGVSRSGATIVGGLMLGLPRRTIIEFSFLLAVPTMLAATGLDLLKSGHLFSAAQFLYMLVGTTTAFLVAFPTLKLFLKFSEKRGFMFFGIYRMIAAVLFWYFV